MHQLTTPAGPTLDKAGAIRFDRLSVGFESTAGARLRVLDSFSLDVEDGEFVAVVGPSGCGKSTILNALSGLIVPTAGEVTVGHGPARQSRHEIGYLFQRDALLPWRTALQNVMLPLRFRGVGRAEARERAMEWMRRVRLDGFESHYPHQLSGGMKKRVALAAIFVFAPKVLLMDEPFSALDVQTRTLMENELLQLWQETRQTVIFVTHDIEEAVGLADRVVVLSARPATITNQHLIDLPRPRDLTELRFDRAFQETYQSIWDDLRSDALESYESEIRTTTGNRAS